ncbi:MAG: Fe-S protein assembly co-chaperone HscB [Sphingobacteriia bacterium]|nr:Fe-S protein assembly co-chaperone HscB [Sphingobacteriia bacterium]
MNYFELYDIPVSFRPDQALVKKRFYALSRQYHPDFFGSSDEAQQQEALEKSAQVNQAFNVFQSPDATIKYILQLHGMLEEEEKYSLSPDFLMKVMDLNEQVMEMDKNDAAVKAAVESDIQALQTDIYEPVEAIMANYQEGITSEKELLQVKSYYYQKKYLDRITRGLL